MNQSVTSQSAQGRPVIFGEVLFDSFPDGSTVLGGAPFNVAWHLQGFGMQPLLISRVGNDDLGRRITQTMSDWGMDIDGVQIDDEHPTGTVQVSITNGQPQFSIVPDQAYDFIETEIAQDVLQNISVALLYHGSLAVRNPVSHTTLMAIRNTNKAMPLFIDINLRAPWWDRAGINQLVQGATWLKLNDAELAELTDLDSLQDEQWLLAAQTMQQDYGLQLLIVTRGDQGATIMTADNMIQGEPHPVESLVDTVGAGDAFSAVTLLGLLQGWPLAHTLRCALEFGSLLCGHRGATIQDQDTYRICLEKWDRFDA